MDFEQWQTRWDAQQSAYLPDREQRFDTMIDVVEAIAGRAPRVLDLAGGTGSISRRLLARLPAASSVILDVDPVLLTIASGSFAADARLRVCRADLAEPSWAADLGEPEESFDAVVTATALHWLAEERVARLYREVLPLLRQGGVFANADHMADPGLSSLSETFDRFAAARSERIRAATSAPDWDQFWSELRDEPELAGGLAERDRRFGGRGGASHTESRPSSAWHVEALTAAGFVETGLAWRGLSDAMVVALRP